MELFRFQVVRPVLSQPSDGLDVQSLARQSSEPGGPGLRKWRDRFSVPKASGDLTQRVPSVDVTAIRNWLDAFSSQLAVHGDLVEPKEAIKLLPGDWLSQVGSQEWADLGQNLAVTLLNAMESGNPPSADVIEPLCRELLVFDLITTLASDHGKSEKEHTLQTAADVQAMVSWRHVIMPSNLFPSQGNTPLLACRPGVTDFYVVHDEWKHYEAGELAAVINVLPGETFENRIRHSQEVDTLTSTTTVTTTSQLTEQQQTTSSSLSQTSASDASLNVGAQGQVQVSYQFGPTNISTSLGAELQSSQSQSDSKALTTAYQTVQRAVKSVTQEVTTVQSQRTITRDSTYDDHKLQNTGNDVTVGMYRWLTEVHYVQLVRYPNRFVLEFEVPEPGAWLRWALQNTSTADWDHPDPGPFTLHPDAFTHVPVAPEMIDSTNYQVLATQWQVQGLTPPPPETVTLSVKLTADPPQPGNESRVLTASDNTLSVPTGYQATSWTAQVVARLYPSEQISAKNPVSRVSRRVELAHDTAPADPIIPPQDFDIVVTVAGSDTSLDRLSYDPKDSKHANEIDDSVSGTLSGNCGEDLGNNNIDGLKSGTIPITVYAYDYFIGFSCVVNVKFKRLDETYAQWQETTFEQVAAAYQALLNAFRLERDTRNQQTGGLSLAGPPELNQSRAVNELRRMVIQDLRGELVDGHDSPVLTDGAQPFVPGEPYVPGASRQPGKPT
jgi:hypothetical protein